MQIKIIDITDDGRAVAKYNGKTVFCKGGQLGEIIEAEKTKEKKNLIFAKKTKLIESSPFKEQPLCPHFNECDGCRFQDITYKKELELKQKSVLNKLQRLAKLDIEDIEIETNTEYNYRNKIDLKVEDGKIGYYNRKTHNLVSITTCKIASEAIQKIITKISKEDLSKVSNIKIRSNYLNEVQISLDNLTEELLEKLKTYDEVVEIYLKEKNYKLVYRKKEFIDKIGDLKFIISPASFFQVNKYNTKLLYDTAKTFLNTNQEQRILDLYCGIGTTTMYIGNGNNTVGVEVVEDAIKDANKNKELNNFAKVQFIREKSENIINKLVKEKFDTIIVDPPRKGVDSKVLDAIINSSAQNLLYISCDPATLARDLKILTENKFKVEKVKLVDMFPKTLHVESVVLMTRVAPTK